METDQIKKIEIIYRGIHDLWFIAPFFAGEIKPGDIIKTSNECFENVLSKKFNPGTNDHTWEKTDDGFINLDSNLISDTQKHVSGKTKKMDKGEY